MCPYTPPRTPSTQGTPYTFQSHVRIQNLGYFDEKKVEFCQNLLGPPTLGPHTLTTLLGVVSPLFLAFLGIFGHSWTLLGQILRFWRIWGQFWPNYAFWGLLGQFCTFGPFSGVFGSKLPIGDTPSHQHLQSTFWDFPLPFGIIGTPSTPKWPTRAVWTLPPP